MKSFLKDSRVSNIQEVAEMLEHLAYQLRTADGFISQQKLFSDELRQAVRLTRGTSLREMKLIEQFANGRFWIISLTGQEKAIRRDASKDLFKRTLLMKVGEEMFSLDFVVTNDRGQGSRLSYWSDEGPTFAFRQQCPDLVTAIEKVFTKFQADIYTDPEINTGVNSAITQIAASAMAGNGYFNTTQPNISFE